MSKFKKGDRVLYIQQDLELDGVGDMVGKHATILEEQNEDLYKIEFIDDVTFNTKKIKLLNPKYFEIVRIFKVGDTVELLNRDKHPNEESNFTVQESLQLEISYKVAYVSSPDNNGRCWIKLYKNGVLHHPDKFRLDLPIEKVLPYKANDLVRLNKAGSERDKRLVRVISLPKDNGTETVLVKVDNTFFKYAPELLNLVWSYHEFAIDDKVTLADYKHPFDNTSDWQITEDGLSMHNVYTIKDVTATGQILLDIGVFHHEPEYFKMFDRKDKTKLPSGIIQVKRDLTRKGHEWISLFSVK